MNQNNIRNHYDSMMEYSLPFAAWELRLYLDTHPNDERALSAFKKLCASTPNGGCNYACAVFDKEKGMACGCKESAWEHAYDDKSWRWIDDPWPWEIEANMAGGCR